MRRECRERFPCHQLQRKPPVNDPGMHHATHLPWCMSRSLTCSGGENVPGIPGACAARKFTYLVRGPCNDQLERVCSYQLHPHSIPDDPNHLTAGLHDIEIQHNICILRSFQDIVLRYNTPEWHNYTFPQENSLLSQRRLAHRCIIIFHPTEYFIGWSHQNL